LPKYPDSSTHTFNPDFIGTVVNRAVEPSEFIIGISSIDSLLNNLQGSGMIGVAGFCQIIYGNSEARKFPWCSFPLRHPQNT
jgi:hypothetical protein